ncbi:MAG TPA: hypothetical protein VJ111_03775 [Chitinophagaceae bacterium]|nr:hypothetical protein [Chitinophagaceae bacterium]
MKSQRSNNKLLFPVTGICLFIILYFIAAFLYPGGSEVNREAKGFSWMHNYWCDLLEPHAGNGERNTARPAAIIAMGVLCISIAVFWYYIPRLFTFKPIIKKIIQYTGIMSMGMLVLLQADFHDTVINISGALGIIAITVILVGLYKNHSYMLFIAGLFCLLLFFLNNYIYYTNTWIRYLAIIQKISFFLFLLWFCLLSIQLFKKARS